MGLFGPSPYEIEQARLQQYKGTANQLAGMDPFQRANAMIGAGSGLLAGKAMEGLGFVDPQVEQAKRLQNLSSGIDLTTAEGA